MAAFTHAIATHAGGGGDDDDAGSNDPMAHMKDVFGPAHVDQFIRQAISSCWMALPKERRNVDEVERQVRRLVERALANLREDDAAFG